MKSIPGWLGTIFGSLGTLICVALLVLTWVMCTKFNTTLKRGTAAIITVTTRLESGATSIDTRVEASRVSLEDFSKNLEQRLSEAALNPKLPQPAAEKLYRQSVRLSDQLQEWQNYAATIHELTLLIDELFRSFPGVTPPDAASGQPLLSAVEEAQQYLDSAKSAVDELASRIDPLETPPTRNLFNTFIQPRVKQIDQALLQVIAGSEAFAEGVDLIEQTVMDTSQRLQRLIAVIGIVATLLIIWLGAGQVCLAKAGWLNLKRDREDS
ncbi:MAG: hypothetical protein HRU46_09065 [Verrucomicrobiales bacterium]|nr:hypothetical protein [Verrucomicrobiales bacterium]